MDEQQRKNPVREVLAAVSIVASLLFVGFEIRQNTQASASTAIQAAAALQVDVYLTMLEDEELLSLVARVIDGGRMSDFDARENFRLRVLVSIALKVTESRYRQASLGVIPEEEWFGANNSLYQSDYMRDVWPTVKLTQAPDFVEFVEDRWELSR